MTEMGMSPPSSLNYPRVANPEQQIHHLELVSPTLPPLPPSALNQYTNALSQPSSEEFLTGMRFTLLDIIE